MKRLALVSIKQLEGSGLFCPFYNEILK